MILTCRDNEAFAAEPLTAKGYSGMDDKTMDEKVNVNGSAVAVGPPIGATARHPDDPDMSLRRRGKKSGVCAIVRACAGRRRLGGGLISRKTASRFLLKASLLSVKD
jgi:hypothetical protein